jgi:hypothetical protein
MGNHGPVLCSFGIEPKMSSWIFPSLVWIPKVQKYPSKQRYIAGFAKCSMNPLFKLLSSVISAVKTGLQS